MEDKLQKVIKIHEVLKVSGVYVSGIAVIGMMLLIVTDVVLRNVFSSPISGTYEIVQYYLMPLAIFPALAFTYSSGVLPRLSEVVEKLPKKFNQVNRILIYVIEMVIFTFLTIYGWKFAMSGLADQMAIPVSGNLIPLYPIYFLVPIGFALVLMEVLLANAKKLQEKRTQKLEEAKS
ncbi:TRAP transporter small permease [Alkalihalophilus lindianensis]|uniref:TRAP transporter small permease n=1 Tax=Alkalihalophilus lindianensis TaxID=1630542 RepID=A0ABU3XEP1_9BACI|nr:TRAP transporter small permease [Alkalihalophilus lindianensis]MDV2686087.1 TRAP transporter small permease [Alkalihalophilus lindianensis]